MQEGLNDNKRRGHKKKTVLGVEGVAVPPDNPDAPWTLSFEHTDKHVKDNIILNRVINPNTLGYEARTLPANHSGGIYFFGDGALGDVFGWIPLTKSRTPAFFATVGEPQRLWSPSVGPNGRVLYIESIDRDDPTGYYSL